jgi:hypothetical protein
VQLPNVAHASSTEISICDVFAQVGGVTFQEARVVHEFNELNRESGHPCRAVLGGDHITRTRTLVKEVAGLDYDEEEEEEGEEEPHSTRRSPAGATGGFSRDDGPLPGGGRLTFAAGR